MKFDYKSSIFSINLSTDCNIIDTLQLSMLIVAIIVVFKYYTDRKALSNRERLQKILNIDKNEMESEVYEKNIGLY